MTLEINEYLTKFPQSLTRILETLDDRTSGVVNVKADFGAVGDGITDDGPAIQTALNVSRAVYLPFPGDFFVGSTLYIPANTTLIGNWRFGRTQDAREDVPTDHARITFADGITGMQTPSISSGFEWLGIGIEGIHLHRGAIQLDVRNGGTGLTINHMYFNNPTEKGFASAGFCQEWFFDDLHFNGGQYGLYMDDAVGSGGTPSLFDKSVMRRIYTSGQSINGIWTKFAISASCIWDQPTLINITQDGWVIDGVIRDWNINNINTEAIGFLGASPTAVTTGSITTGTKILVVASATGLSIGNTLTVEGAGANGKDLSSIVTDIVTTTVTLTDNAGTTVTDNEVTKYLYSDIKFTKVIGQPASFTFVGGQFGLAHSQAAARYGMDLTGVADVRLIGTRSTRPIYDPDHVATIVHPAQTNIRTPQNFLSEVFQSTTLSHNAWRSQVVSPNGRDFVVGMRDSNGNSTGTHGNFEIRVYDGNRTRYLKWDGTTHKLLVRGGITPGDELAATGAISEGTASIFYGDAAPTGGTWIVGDIVFNNAPAIGNPIGWSCTVAGTPGTWVAWANL